MQKNLLIILFIIWVAIFHSCSTLNNAEQIVAIFDMRELSRELSIGQVSVTSKENYVVINIPEQDDIHESTPHFIMQFKDGLFMVDMYEVENSDTADINISYLSMEGDSTLAVLVGNLGSTLPTAIQLLQQNFPDVRVLGLLNITGGVDMYSMAEAMEQIREYGYGTWASKESEILSAGVDIFMAGKFRYAEVGARMGIHDFTHLDNNDYNNNNPAIALMKDTYQKMGISPKFFDFMRSVPSNSMHFLSTEEMQKYQITNTSSTEEFLTLLGVE